MSNKLLKKSRNNFTYNSIKNKILRNNCNQGSEMSVTENYKYW